ncbi:MAG: hypothetical protein HYT87_01210 [Nitrospirae bacterium]|nr:hypothetical protein [Nitrospirota bacterium]
MGTMQRPEKSTSDVIGSRRGLRLLKRWEVVELINWCQRQDEEDLLHLQVSERGPDTIAIEATDDRVSSTLVVDWQSGKANIETEQMTRRDSTKFWAEILCQALDGKIEKAIHRGYFRCTICKETIWLSGPLDIREHLTQHKIPVEQVMVGEGISLKVGEKTVDLDSFLVGEDTPIQ